MESDETPVYIPVEDVADLLGVSQRQATRYAKKVRTQQDGRRIMYHRADVERLAQERGVKHDRPLAVQTEVIPPGRLLDIITQQQRELDRLNRDNGRLQQQVETAEQQQRQLQLDTDETRRQLAEFEERAKAAEATAVEAERLRQELVAELETAATMRDALADEVAQLLRRSWWRRLLGK